MKPRSQTFVRILVLAICIGCAGGVAATESPDGIVATFSIVAIDPETGAMGCAVQSRYFAVGAVVPWGEADVGVIATQANVNVGWGPQGMALLREGLSAEAVLDRLKKEDTFPGLDGRQAAIVDAKGNIAVYTGETANYWAGHKTGENYSAQGNILTGPEVVEAMGTTFENAKGSLSERLVAALDAGQQAGGDSRGRQSAALMVVQKGGGRNINNDVATRLHVDDHKTPIKELQRLLNIQLAMRAMQSSREHSRDKRFDEALRDARRAVDLWPETSDTHLNFGLLAYLADQKDEALESLKKASSLNPLFRGQLDSTLSWTRHPGLDEEFMKRLFGESP